MVFTLLHHLSIKPEGATGDLLFDLNCHRVLCSHAHGNVITSSIASSLKMKKGKEQSMTQKFGSERHS